MAKQHPGFNEHPAVQKGEGHGKPAEGHGGIDKAMFGGRGGSKGGNVPRQAAQGQGPQPVEEDCGG